MALLPGRGDFGNRGLPALRAATDHRIMLDVPHEADLHFRGNSAAPIAVHEWLQYERHFLPDWLHPTDTYFRFADFGPTP